ncbi:MAG: glycosyltransferase [Desulfobulbus sp.]|nr:MAG: glycosyltransferase [Desulfobulbus sp.]
MVDISLITATLNSADTLADCLESVIKQNLCVEHIVVDGGSDDETLAIACQYSGHLSHVIPGPDKGIYDAMNKGITACSSEVVGILNSDDFYPSDDILSKISSLFENPEIQACYGDLVYVDRAENGVERICRYWRAGPYRGAKQFYYGWMMPHPTLFVRRSVYEQYGMFNLEMGTAADYELMIRLFVKNRINVEYLPRVIVHMRAGGVSNASLGNRFRANRMDRKAWKVNGLKPYFWTLSLKPVRKIGQWVFRAVE